MVDPAARFPELTPFIERWAHATELARSEQRWAASPEAFAAFYRAVLPRLDDLLDYLDNFRLGEMPADVLPYFHLALAFAEIAPHCELYDYASEVPNSFDARRFVAAHGEVADG